MYMFAIIQEKEERVREMMRMNGMRMSAYWLSAVTFCLLLYVATVLVFWSFGYWVLDLDLFKRTDLTAMIVFMGGWGVSQVGMAILFSVFISSTKTSSIFGYILSIILIMVGNGYNALVYSMPRQIPVAYLLIPHFSLSRLFYVFNLVTTKDIPVSLNTFLSEPQCLECILSLYVGGTLMGILGVYLNEVIQQTYGVKKHPLFFLKFMRRRRPKPLNESVRSQRLEEIKEEDEDCRLERKTVEEEMENGRLGNWPLLVNGIRKVYKGNNGEASRTAVRSLFLSVRQGETFGLLGPNGAGNLS
jgi:hypothetical protein